ncbi:peptidoglycan-recognition protein LC-like [Macrosteles quadrilineatus]|uniref:peptidoglycan-recognition protein LC-like n=1 Tax=Macrosteles quadrilineatus TaxID=74068 RepID=UPI0023E19AEF|nr:peptidoglycan-recognition protein LC-like [Macrosteles quadrilineatus]XP_054264066.1 peptidoglycan-recognition protein LC-like [Macrosteles quadrilineatus]
MGAKGVKLDVGPVEEVSREEWGARLPLVTKPIQFPVAVITVHFTNTQTCSTREECIKIVKELQRRDMDDKNLIDIRYNFLIGGDGAIYEGRGWKAAGIRVPVIHEMVDLFLESIDVAYIGTVQDADDSEILRSTFEKLVKLGKLRRYIRMREFYLWKEGGFLKKKNLPNCDGFDELPYD